ncbi:TonB-dependent receptor [Dyadobacter sp. UP-52]|uniref:TonB-dependent receptor n=2 Tax=Dyadobacter subterraneus TaxID=2773304 RepID=A0ABR9W8R4_9BACT|nr:TonB-dependent receptor [Dyadobacter subterraneus]
MKLKVFNIFLFCLIMTKTLAQTQLSGIIISKKDSLPIQGCTIFVTKGGHSTTSDENGKFSVPVISPGNHTVHISHPDFKSYQHSIKTDGQPIILKIVLHSRENDLEEVTVTEKQSDFGYTRMRGVENMGIYEGKKTEVILPDKLVANLATNNARQVYARVPGLNIYENDGAGLQLSIGGRGLDPNRSSNFNVRQNGYDISADALGYPESYYTPPIEAVGRIQIIRGAASLQYGTQFGGLLNFVMKKPTENRKVELVVRQSTGSFGFYNSFTSVSGTVGKLSYYTFVQYKRGDGWRPNSHFNNVTVFSNVNYQISEKTKVGIDITHMNYLAQQPGGQSDDMFNTDPRQSNRERNWFKVNWNMLALNFDHKFNATNEFNLRVFGLSAFRYSLGFRPNRVATVDDNSERDLIKGDFTNWGAEARYLKRYYTGKIQNVLLVGTRYYHGFNHSLQGAGSNGKDANFNFVDADKLVTYDYRFPNRNVSVFAENILYVNDKFSITPGIRFEYIRTIADGYYGNISRDLAGNIINISKTDEYRTNGRQFVIAGLGLSYKPAPHLDMYGNLSQNYRSITFSDMRISNPSSVIDPNMKDEKGHSLDLGIRSYQTSLYNFDVSGFYLNYNNRIGEVQFYDESNRVLRKRGNVGRAVIMGLESYGEADFWRLLIPKTNFSGVLFTNIAVIHSTYKESEIVGVKGKQVEFVPKFNLKSGVRFGYKNLKASFQYTHLSDQFTEATNAVDGGVTGVVGIIPAYTIMDASVSYEYKKLRFEGSINNLANRMYFTRRATGYPGPGILPSDGRGFYVTVQVKI